MIEIDIYKILDGSSGEMPLEIKLEIESGSFLAIRGESGSGKSTLLRVLAGLSEASGRIVVDSEVWLDEGYSLDIQSRKIGFLFQDYALFENMTILQNLLFVNRDLTLAKRLLKLCELDKMSHRLPHSLSGGQKQRVALCRAMMRRPKLLLLDEPLSALDMDMRIKLQDEIALIHKEFGTTTLMVSHDFVEIYKLSNRIITLNSGKIIEDTTPQNISLKDNLLLDGVVLDIIEQDGKSFYLISVLNQIVKIELGDRKIEAGERVKLSSNSLAIDLGGSYV